MRKAIGKRLLTYDQLVTFIKEVEWRVNARPLVYVSDGVNSSSVIYIYLPEKNAVLILFFP